jgi:hypothetical protein
MKETAVRDMGFSNPRVTFKFHTIINYSTTFLTTSRMENSQTRSNKKSNQIGQQGKATNMLEN